MESVTNQIIQYLLGVLQILAIWAIKEGVSYLKTRKENILADTDATQYNHFLNMAKSAYFIGEEACKFIPKSGDLKKEMFNAELLKLIPGVTQDEIDHLRQAVVGEFNSELQSSKLLDSAPEFNPSTDEADVKVVSAPAPTVAPTPDLVVTPSVVLTADPTIAPDAQAQSVTATAVV